MLTIDTRECRIMVTMPHPHGGVASMFAALREAGIEVIRIEPRGGRAGIYQLIVSDRQRLAMSIPWRDRLSDPRLFRRRDRRPVHSSQ